MVLKELKLIFDKPVYYSGETVKGKLCVVLQSPQRHRGIKITIKGVGRTSWRIKKGELYKKQHRIIQKSIQAFGYEVYFSRRFYIPGVYSGDPELPPGEHMYPFEYDLPKMLPSSFESELGYIRYTAKAIFDFPWRYDQQVEQNFTVVSSYDLNTDPRAQLPVMEKRSKTFGTCCTSSPITINFSTPVRGYVPGQLIPVKVDIENNKGIKIYYVKLTLQKNVIFRVNSPRVDEKTKSFIEVEVSKGPLKGKGIISYEQELKVPDLLPTSLSNLGIIVISYTLNLEASVEGWRHRNLKMVTPILIGTVPLANYQSLVDCQAQNERNKQQDASKVFPPCAVYYSAAKALPTYEDSIFGIRKNSEQNERSPLIPK